MAGSEEDVLRLATELRLDDPNEAITILKQFLSTSPHSVRPKLLLASIYSDEYGEDLPGAVRLYREILADDPNNIEALTGLALLPNYPELGVSVQERLNLLVKAADQSRESWALLNLAFKAWDLARHSEALEAFERLAVIARANHDDHTATLALRSIESIRRGEKSTSSQYYLPDVYRA